VIAASLPADPLALEFVIVKLAIKPPVVTMIQSNKGAAIDRVQIIDFVADTTV